MFYILIIILALFNVVVFVSLIKIIINDRISLYDKLYYYADKINYALEEIGKIKKELKKIGVINDKTQS